MPSLPAHGNFFSNQYTEICNSSLIYEQFNLQKYNSRPLQGQFNIQKFNLQTKNH